MMKMKGKDRRACGRRDEGGVALLLVLLFVVLLSAIIVDYCYEMRVEAALVGNRANSLAAYVAAKSAVASGLSLLQVDAEGTSELVQNGGTAGTEFDALTDVWANGIPYQQINNAVMRCTVSDEYGKLNLNAMLQGAGQQPNETLESAVRMLFLARGVEEDPTDAILDWIDEDDDVRLNGAESDYYAGLYPPHTCKNAPLDSLEELLLIRGITVELFFGDEEQGQAPLSDLLTVHGRANGVVNANTAAYETLVAIGNATSREGLADLVISAREEYPFETREDLKTRGVVESDSSNGQIFGIRGGIFRIQGDGIANDGKVRIEVFVRRNRAAAADGGGMTAARLFHMVDWREMR